MKMIVAFINLILLLSCDDDIKTNSDFKTYLMRDSIYSDRAFMVVLPDNYQQEKAYPLILAFHGAGSDYHDMRRITNFDQNAQDFIVVYPQAKVENWEEGCKCNKPYRLGIDDVGFINQLLNELSEDYLIQEDNIFAVGFSQGGLFVQNLGCKLYNRFNSIAIVAASMSKPLSQECNPENRLSVIAIHVENDAVLPFEGSNEGTFSLISSPDAMAIWASFGDGNSTPIIKEKSNFIKYIYNENTPFESVMYKIKGGSHTWPKSKLSSSTVIIEFFNSKIQVN